ncbi:hypothetical protein FAGKG844_520007 [Frankia sp. AgKG'84/4]
MVAEELDVSFGSRATVRVYQRLLGAGFRRQSAYRAAMLGGLAANTAFGLLKAGVHLDFPGAARLAQPQRSQRDGHPGEGRVGRGRLSASSRCAGR